MLFFIIHLSIWMFLWMAMFWAGKNYTKFPLKWDVFYLAQKLLYLGPYAGSRINKPKHIYIFGKETGETYTEKDCDTGGLAFATFMITWLWEITILLYLLIYGIRKLGIYVDSKLTSAEGPFTKLFKNITQQEENIEN